MRSALVLSFLALVGCGDPVSTLVDDGTVADLAGGGVDLAGGGVDLAMSTAPKINVTFTGACTPDFSGPLIVVANNQSMALTRSDAPLLGQIQLHLTKTSGLIAISSAERMQNGDVINVLSNSVTWTNLSAAKPDPIKGTLTIHSYDEQAGKADLAFDGVVVENVQDHTTCKLDGTLVTYGKTF